jgi:hypothetical protein
VGTTLTTPAMRSLRTWERVLSKGRLLHVSCRAACSCAQPPLQVAVRHLGTRS